ncbi:MAG: hypothetical protein IJ122_03920 [Methanobrevibacter sp.]|nr:hypothetical protein [Methanobrevibacter sp.]
MWPILKDMQKFSDNDSATSTPRRPRGHNVSSQEDSPTPESPTMASPGISSFSLNISSDDAGGSSSQRPIGVKKAKLKKRAAEDNASIVATFTEGQDKLVEVFEKNNLERQRTNDILERKLETKIVMMDLDSIKDPRKREFVDQQQRKIMAKHAWQQDYGSGSSSEPFGDFFNNIGESRNGLEDY